MKILPSLLLLLGCLTANTQANIFAGTDPKNIWAVLLAGSSEWYNYRHQSDVCHAYQILHKHGVPDSNIIVFMRDDIAHNDENPYPGVIINHPNGPNVYTGVPKDYIGKDVTPENFLKVLKGHDMKGTGSGKTLKSDNSTRVFINMVDHGAPGIFAFPEDHLHARELKHAIKHMYRKQMYKEMVIYMEACESGSMFEDLLPSNMNVFAVTAANAEEPSWACYMDQELHTLLGDVFSVKWMEDSDMENLKAESVHRQYTLVHKSTTTSHVMEYGDILMSWLDDVGEFQGEEDDSTGNAEKKPSYNKKNSKKRTQLESNDIFSEMNEDDPCINSAIMSPEVPLASLQSRLAAAKNSSEKKYWKQQTLEFYNNRMYVNNIVKKLTQEVTSSHSKAYSMIDGSKLKISDWTCYEDVVDSFSNKCINIGKNPYVMRHLQTLVNLCENGYAAGDIIKAMTTVCINSHVSGIH